MRIGIRLRRGQKITRAHTDALRGEPKSQWEPLPPSKDAVRRSWAWLWGPLVAICCIGVVVSGIRFRLNATVGYVERIDHGRLLKQDGPSAPWDTASLGSVVHEGALLQAEPGTVAVIRFPDGAQMRVESEGEWEIVRTRQSQNERRSLVTVRQSLGKASYVSSPPREAASASLWVYVPSGQIDLVGVASAHTNGVEQTTVQVLQGMAEVGFEKERIQALAGDDVEIAPVTGIRMVTSGGG